MRFCAVSGPPSGFPALRVFFVVRKLFDFFFFFFFSLGAVVSRLSAFCLKEPCFWRSLLTRSDLRVPLATWSPFGTSLCFALFSDLFGSKGYLSDVVALWDESVCLTCLDLRVTLATWSPFETSLCFAVPSDSFRSKGYLSDVAALWDKVRSGGD